MEISMIIAAVIVFAPALLMFYYILKGYTYPAVEHPFFEDAKAFTLFAIGLIEGFFISWFYVQIFGMANILYGVLIAVIQALALLVVLNLKRFHAKSDTVFYGLAMGLGQGVGVAFGVAVNLLSIAFLTDVDIPTIIMAIAFVAQELMLLCAVGTTVGEGVARLRLTEFTTKAMLYALVSMSLWSLMFSLDFIPYLWVLPMVAMVGTSGYFFYDVVHKRLSLVVDDVLKSNGIVRKDFPR